MVFNNFEAQWKAIKERKKGDEPEVPKITKALSVIKWTQAFGDYLDRIIGHCTITLSYVVREDLTVPVHTPPLVPRQPHSEDHGSVEAEIVSRASHTHSLYCDHKSLVYYKLEDATRSTPYTVSIKPFQCSKDGWVAWLALTRQFAKQDKWEQELKTQDDMLHTILWKGQSNFSLEKFIQQYRNAFVSMQYCAEYVQYLLPTEQTLVG